MKYLFIPCWSGDFRLEAAPQDTSLLTVEDPTPGDREVLQRFLTDARARGWLAEDEGIQLRGKTSLPIAHPMSVVAPVMAALLTTPGETWTAIRRVGGKVDVVDGNTLPPEKSGEPAIEAVAVVQRPQRGCPEPEPATRRASEVLWTFCTATQQADWQSQGYLLARGNASGRLYRVWHEDAANKAGMKRCLTLTDGTPVCAWDRRVPPEEQALSLKLAVEHREAWLLHVGNGVMADYTDDTRRFA